MIDQLRSLYDRELDYFRALSAEFAERFPKIAARLGVDEGGVRDPHAERFIQAAALLNARTRFKLEDDLPELVESLVDVLYPHLLRPMPSVAMVRMEMDPKKGATTEGHRVARGSVLETTAPDGERLTYRTTADNVLWPVNVTDVRFENQPLDGPSPADAVSRLAVKLTPITPSLKWDDFLPDKLRLTLVMSQVPQAGRLLELLFENLLDVRLSDGDRVSYPVPGELGRGGLSPDESTLPHDARSFSGYRLLSELFACPQKFLAFDVPNPLGVVRGLPKEERKALPGELWLHFHFDSEDRELSRLIDRTSVQSGVVPVVNLFRRTAGNIPVDHERAEVRAVPDSRNEASVEVWGVDDVAGVLGDGSRVPARPFYRNRADDRLDSGSLFWHATRRPRGETLPDDSRRVPGESKWNETYLTLVDFNHGGDLPELDSISMTATCFNRDLPNKLAATGRPPLFRGEGADASLIISTVMRPTPTRRPGGDDVGMPGRWRWLSHVSLSALPLSQAADGEDSGPGALQGLLRLYNPLSDGDLGLVDGIEAFACRGDLAYLAGVPGGFCRGVEARLDLDESKFAGHSPYLLASVLREFLGRYVSVNSFVRLRAATSEMRARGDEWLWPPMAGARAVL